MKSFIAIRLILEVEYWLPIVEPIRSLGIGKKM
jgi:hypothetical protein